VSGGDFSFVLNGKETKDIPEGFPGDIFEKYGVACRFGSKSSAADRFEPKSSAAAED